ncbi:MAG TPA: hypothetical protein VFI91_08140 [Longimicrobiaceae bacterium]|nr:hypothetical protein [Longimicrobiaceae bacterium]
MSEILFQAHSGIRYLVLLAGVIALVYFIYGWATSRVRDKTSRVIGSIFVGILDLQVLLGIGVVLTRPFYPALGGHILMMALAAASAHLLVGKAMRGSPTDRRAFALGIGGILLTLVLIVGGILSIGRSIV